MQNLPKETIYILEMFNDARYVLKLSVHLISRVTQK